METATNWFFWALLSAVFAALTAIFAEIGLEGVDSDRATLIRTVVILAVLAGFVYFAGKWRIPFQLAARTWLILVLSSLATGASWVCYFRALKPGSASKVAPVDKLSLLLVTIFGLHLSGRTPVGSRMGWHFMVGAGVLLLAVRR